MVVCICFSKLPKNITKQALSSGHGRRAGAETSQCFQCLSGEQYLCKCAVVCDLPPVAGGCQCQRGTARWRRCDNCSRWTNSDADGPDFDFCCVLSWHSRSEHKPINLALAAGRPAPCRAFRAGAGRHRGNSPGHDLRHPAVRPLALQEPCRTWICSEH